MFNTTFYSCGYYNTIFLNDTVHEFKEKLELNDSIVVNQVYNVYYDSLIFFLIIHVGYLTNQFSERFISICNISLEG